MLDLAAGQPIDKSLLVPTNTARENNSHGGKGIGATIFSKFLEACAEIINLATAVHERRHSQVVYASVATSPEDLIRQGTVILERSVELATAIR